MKKVLFILLLTACFAVKAQTIQVSGLQTGVWDADTVLVTGDVIVVDSVQVMPGVVVLFDGFYSIMVMKNDKFKALGTETDSIVFTVADTTGFHIYNSSVGGWNGFQMNGAGHVLFDYCVLEYGKAADTLDRFGGALNINQCNDVEIRHTTLRCNFSREQGGAICAIDSEVTMSDCDVNDNLVYTEDGTYAMYGGGAQFLRCVVNMTGMEFNGNYCETCIGGALSLDSCEVSLDRAVFTDNVGLNGGGMYLMRSNHREGHLSNLLFDNNLSGHFGGGLAFKNASPEVSNILVTNNQSIGVNCCGVFFFEESSPKMTNCIVYGNYPDQVIGNPDTVQMWAWTFEGFAPEFRNCLIEGGLDAISGYEYITVFENVIDVDPMFVDAANHDFHLAEGSPCINSGNPNTPQYVLNGVDLDGNPRVINQRIDIGPYEYTVASVLDHSAKPFAKLVGNPLHAQSCIVFNEAVRGDVEISVYAMTGRCVANKELRLEGSRSFAMGELAEKLVPGVYLIELRHGNKVCTLKAVR